MKEAPGTVRMASFQAAILGALSLLSASAIAAVNPQVTGVSPTDGQSQVALDGFVATDLKLAQPGQGVDAKTLNSQTVKLVRSADNQLVVATMNTSGGGDTVVLQPSALLEPDTAYTFQVTAGVKDTAGNSFTPFTSHFKTGRSIQSDPSLAFEKVTLPAADGESYTCVTVGPDHRLYATTLMGLIVRFSIAADGTLSQREDLNSIQLANGGNRLVTSIVFDPASTPSNLIAWVSHGIFALTNATDFTGKVTRVSGPTLGTVQDFVVGLPRSIRDHLNNQLAFGPDGAIYFPQGSNSAMGAPDLAWGLRPERLLNAAILRLDPKLVTQPPLNVQTEQGGSYDPFAAQAPLTLYATGVRNAYDLVFARNGSLYVPTNGSAAGGATPVSPPVPFFSTHRLDQAQNGPLTAPFIPAIAQVNQTEDDWLFRVEKGGYYGHPNPLRFEFVMNGGNPTAQEDPAEISQYPVGTQPDRNYRGAALNLGRNHK